MAHLLIHPTCFLTLNSRIKRMNPPRYSLYYTRQCLSGVEGHLPVPPLLHSTRVHSTALMSPVGICCMSVLVFTALLVVLINCIINYRSIFPSLQGRVITILGQGGIYYFYVFCAQWSSRHRVSF